MWPVVEVAGPHGSLLVATWRLLLRAVPARRQGLPSNFAAEARARLWLLRPRRVLGVLVPGGSEPCFQLRCRGVPLYIHVAGIHVCQLATKDSY